MPIQESNILTLPHMNLKTLLPILALSIVPASASVIYIDNFGNPQTVNAGDGDPLSNQSGILGGPNVLGGARSIEVTKTSGDPELVDSARVNTTGTLTFSLAAADGGYALLIWDGDTDGIVNQAGIASTDLSAAGQNYYIGLSVRSDLAAPITMTFYSGVGNSSSYTFNTPGTGFAVPYTNYLIPMSSFVSMSGTGANFAGITAATLFIDGQNQPGVDVQIRNYAAMPTPEPATFGMIGAGLIGLAVFRRRKA